MTGDLEHGPHPDDVDVAPSNKLLLGPDGEPTYEVILGEVRVSAGDLGQALAAAADLAAEAGHRDGLVITCAGELDEGATELAREGLRPVDLH